MLRAAVATTLIASLALAHEDPTRAVEALTRELAVTPTASGFLRRSALLRAAHRNDEALDDLRRARARGASLVEVEAGRALALADAGRDSEALAALDAWLRAGGNDAALLTARARLLELASRPGEALLDRSRALAISPTVERALALASLQQRLGREDDARHTLESSLEQLGGAVTLRLALVELERRAKRYDAALVQVRRAMAPLSVKAEWRLRAAELLLEARRPREARAELLVARAELDAVLARRASALQEAARTRVLTLLAQVGEKK